MSIQRASIPVMDRGIIRRLWSGSSREISGFAKKKPLGAVGGVIVAVTVLAAIFAPVIAPSDPYKVHPDQIFASPSASALVGTDQVGRDVFSRLIYGARISLFCRDCQRRHWCDRGGRCWRGQRLLRPLHRPSDTENTRCPDCFFLASCLRWASWRPWAKPP